MKISIEELHELLELTRSENDLKVKTTIDTLEKERRIHGQRKHQLMNDVKGMMDDAESNEVRDAIEIVLTLINRSF